MMRLQCGEFFAAGCHSAGSPDRVVVKTLAHGSEGQQFNSRSEAKIDDHKKAHHLERAGDPPGSNFTLKPRMQLRHKGK